uniref:Uncharacterized protein n=1 Tax=Glossina austeni TaxID=7395 RepID=A0A1A9V0T6_GLOAU
MNKTFINFEKQKQNVIGAENSCDSAAAFIGEDGNNLILQNKSVTPNQTNFYDVEASGDFYYLVSSIFMDLYISKHLATSVAVEAVTLEVVSLISCNKDKDFSEMAACELLANLLVSLTETLLGLINVQEMIKEAQMKGAVIYLLDMFCNSRKPHLKEMCAEILAKMTADRLSGPKWVICRFSIAQKLNFKHLWKDPEILKDIVSNEVVVAGVYLRLFIANPAWTLRKPKQFLSHLLDFKESCLAA